MILLDRDGVLNRMVEPYVKRVEEFVWLPGALAALAKLHKAGWTLGVCSNQSGVARGYMSRAELDAVQARMLADLHAQGVRLSHTELCTSADDAHPDRKPNPGMLEKQRIYHHLADLHNVPFVGDSWSDMQAALSAGARPILLRTGHGAQTLRQHHAELRQHAIAVYDDLAAAVEALLHEHDSSQ